MVKTIVIREYGIVTNLTCPRCDAFVLVYHSPKDEEDKKGMILSVISK